VIGAGAGIITPLAFTMLARATAEQHLGQTMGAAEIGRECGDAAGPLIVGAIAAAAALPFGFLGLAGIIAATQLATGNHNHRVRNRSPPLSAEVGAFDRGIVHNCTVLGEFSSAWRKLADTTYTIEETSTTPRPPTTSSSSAPESSGQPSPANSPDMTCR